MGVPKFFRWISERYPMCSQLIAENRIPEFDNLYLDMNGIIHNCTHKDTDSATYRMTEDKMYVAIFNYIEHLFATIKPKRLFYLAVDGVAPRAKMNQQRSRRFRTAQEAEEALKKARAAGEEIPAEDPFDSNAITPGTAFMVRLSKQLQYFINKKVSEDKEWQGVKVVLSGHEAPGEGEHKIMEYIRLSKAQPDYDPNIRHCLYGLDADLIMLGLLSHDPHFCLLREEVVFGPSTRKTKELEQQNFYLMHLSLLREYLEFEFQGLAEVIPFEYDLERIIDDFILLAFFVGNDFLPNLPNLHINEGALSLMFSIYKKVLPQLDGYINEYGVISFPRLDVLLKELEEFENKLFESEYREASWMARKREKEGNANSVSRRSMTSSQQSLYNKIKSYISKRKTKPFGKLDLPANLSSEDRSFVSRVAKSFCLNFLTVRIEDNEDSHIRLEYARDEDGEEIDEESEQAIKRELRKWDQARVLEGSVTDNDADMERQYQENFEEWKDTYYWERVKFHYDDKDALVALNENYVEGLQWVLHYYYHGVASWSWYYKYHYSPKISDIRLGLNANRNFELGEPFKPFEQLMGVLPERSKKLIPDAFKPLMTDPNSPILDFYPHEFELDMNGKKQAWEAVVKIPFIEESRLLASMKSREHKLTDEERNRNTIGPSIEFSYAPSVDEIYHSSLPGIFPDLPHCHCIMNVYDPPNVDGLELVVGLCKGVQLGEKALAGFPSLKTIPHTAFLDVHGVKVFQLESKNESMVISIDQQSSPPTAEQVAKERVGERIFVNWPFLQEAKVCAISDELFRYEMKIFGGRRQLLSSPHSPSELNEWRRKAERMEADYSKRMGTITGRVEILVHVQPLKGLMRQDDGARTKTYGDVTGFNSEFALQTTVEDVIQEDQRFLESGPVDVAVDFPIDSKAFFLGEFNYGSPLKVAAYNGNRIDVRLLIFKEKEPDFGIRLRKEIANQERYFPSYVVSKKVQMHPLVLSKILSSFNVLIDDQRVNLGLNLKFEAKRQKVLGYSRRNAAGWEFSKEAIDLVAEYKNKFPEFFQRLEARKNADQFDESDFYPEHTAKTKFKEIRDWLKSISSKSFDRVPLDDDKFDAAATAQIEALATSFAESRAQPVASQIKGVPRSALLRPADCEHRLHNQVFALGERVLYVLESGKVPMGMRGTVVGISKSSTPMLDVVFDSNFLSGTTLNGRCSQYRGMTVAASTVLDLSIPQVLVDSKASSAKKGSEQMRLALAPQNPWQATQNAGPSRRGQTNGTSEGPTRVLYNQQRMGTGVGIPPPSDLANETSRGRGRSRGRGGRGGRGAPVRGILHRGQGTQVAE